MLRRIAAASPGLRRRPDVTATSAGLRPATSAVAVLAVRLLATSAAVTAARLLRALALLATELLLYVLLSLILQKLRSMLSNLAFSHGVDYVGEPMHVRAARVTLVSTHVPLQRNNVQPALTSMLGASEAYKTPVISDTMYQRSWCNDVQQESSALELSIL